MATSPPELRLEDLSVDPRRARTQRALRRLFFASAALAILITVGGEGTGDGFAQFFCPGVSDVSDASRPIKDSEAEAFAENVVTWT